jgi:hypothetical protein
LFAGHSAGEATPSTQKFPAGQISDDDVVGQYRPLVQLAHDSFPGHDTNVPSGQSVGVHMPGLSHLYPIGQSVCEMLFASGQ